jgi:hypothetical protein
VHLPSPTQVARHCLPPLTHEVKWSCGKCAAPDTAPFVTHHRLLVTHTPTHPNQQRLLNQQPLSPINSSS